MQPNSSFSHQASEVLGERYLLTPPWLVVEDATVNYVNPKHLFQAHGLRAKLNAITVIRLGSSTLVFYWHWTPCACGTRQPGSTDLDEMKLHDVSDPIEPERE